MAMINCGMWPPSPNSTAPHQIWPDISAKLQNGGLSTETKWRRVARLWRRKQAALNISLNHV